MKPEQKRVLVHAALTALVLAVIGFMFAEFAGTWLSAQGTGPNSADPTPALPEGARYRIPLMMALWGFAFVVIGEFVAARFRKPTAAAAEHPAPDSAEKLLNELLAKAEAESAARESQNPPPVS